MSPGMVRTIVEIKRGEEALEKLQIPTHVLFRKEEHCPYQHAE